MAVEIIGSGIIVGAGAAHKSANINLQPNEFGTGGSFRATMRSGVMAAALAANAEIFQFRWGDAAKKCVIRKVMMEGAGSIAAFTAGVTIAELIIARAWTAVGAGGTPAVMTGNNQKMATTGHATSLLATNGDMRVASTAALTAGTKVLDAQPLGAIVSSVQAAAGAIVFPNNHLINADSGLHPIVLIQNEGLIVRATVPALGTWTFALTVVWDEVDTF